jgi:hypothetical protein
VAADKIRELREVHRRLEGVAGRVLEELNSVLKLYSQSGFYKERPDLLNKLKQLLEVDVEKAEELAEARRIELSKYSNANMGTKAYAALLSVAKDGIYGHATMLLMAEGALADIVLPTPGGAYEKADRIANARGETVDPSYSGRRGRSVGQPSWEDRAASVLLRFLIGYGEADLKFIRVEKEGKKGFQVFRVYGGVETFVGELWIGKVAYFKVSEEELERLVEEAKRTAPDLSGFDKAPQYLEWRATDVSTVKRQIEAGTVHSWQLRWYYGLLGEEQSFSGGASVTKEGIKPAVTAFWPREREDQILRESRWLESVLGQQVESWRQLVDAIDWSWVLERVEELTDKLKPWIGHERMSDVEREGWVRRMLGELALLVHFAEAKRGMDDSRWREERAKRLAKAVEALSGGRIAGEYAEKLARAIIRYAEGHKKEAKEDIDRLAGELGGALKEDVNRVKGEVWGVVEFVLSDMYCLARDCARDEVVRKFVAPALELMMLDKALNKEFDREEARLRFGKMYATALAGDGSVESKRVVLVVGGELCGGTALLRLATLQLLNQLLPKELKFNVRVYVKNGRYYYITAYGEDAARFNRLLAVSAPSAGGEYLSEKFNEFVEEAQVEVRLNENSIRRTEKGRVAADLIISEASIDVKYTVYLLKDVILLHFASSDRGRVELAALLLRHAGVSAEVKKVGDRDEWRVEVTTDKLAAGRKELRDAIRKVVEEALKKGGVDEKKARRWLEKLERGRVLMEGWPKYHVGLTHSGSLVVRYETTDLDNIMREVHRLEKMGLKRGVHFSVKTPGGGEKGYVSILKEGLAYAAWLSVRGKDEQQRKLAATYVELILLRAEEADGGKCGKVCEKVKEIVEKGKAWGSLTLKRFEKEVEVDGRRYVVKVINGGAEFKRGRDGRKLLRIRVTAEVSRVEGEHIVRVVREYAITFGRYGEDNAAMGFAYASVDAPGGREADAERFSALVEALTGKRPRVYHMKDDRIKMECYKEHLDGFARFTELADAIEKWLEETDR